jgi:hypothetical protein
MQIKSYLQTLCRAVALGCMLYALTLVADTARASVLPSLATQLECRQSLLDNSP